MPQLHNLGTARDIAEKNIKRYTNSITRLETVGKSAQVAYEQRDKWLDYFKSHQESGTLDEEQFL